jgi:hypothetical protein
MTALLSCAQDAVAFLSRGESDESDEQLILEEKDSTLELTSRTGVVLYSIGGMP